MSESILESVSDYYGKKVEAHGATPAGVDWNGREGQELRFQQLLKVTEHFDGPFSIDDYGCGYGDLWRWLQGSEYKEVDYLGIDIAPQMVAEASKLYGDRFLEGSASNRTADVAVASGILNVKMGTEVKAWEQYVRDTLETMNRQTRKGFAFNCLTSYSDKDHMRDDLYYGDPNFYFDLCKQEFSPQVSLLHDYGLYEFTIVVRKF